MDAMYDLYNSKDYPELWTLKLVDVASNKFPSTPKPEEEATLVQVLCDK